MAKISGIFPPKTRVQLKELDMRLKNGEDIIFFSEKRYNDSLLADAKLIIDSGAKVVLLTGPSASGKTTTANKLSKAIRQLGVPATVISMDNFFKNKEDYPVLPDGRLDFESVNTLDLPEFHNAVNTLLECGSYGMPVFSFAEGKRNEKREPFSIEPGTVLITEGIHALNPLVSQGLPKSGVMRVYASLRTEFYKGDTRVLSTRDIRIIRRCIRDLHFRSYSIENTFNIWDNIMQGEEKYIKPYKNLVDIVINTSFISEIPVFASKLSELLADKTQGGAHRAVLERIAEGYFEVNPLQEQLLPQDSMLREFLGGLKL